jgi:hypothetical protein
VKKCFNLLNTVVGSQKSKLPQKLYKSKSLHKNIFCLFYFLFFSRIVCLKAPALYNVLWLIQKLNSWIIKYFFETKFSQSFFKLSIIILKIVFLSVTSGVRCCRRSPGPSLSNLAVGLWRWVVHQGLPSQEQTVSHHKKCTMLQAMQPGNFLKAICELNWR